MLVQGRLLTEPRGWGQAGTHPPTSQRRRRGGSQGSPGGKTPNNRGRRKEGWSGKGGGFPSISFGIRAAQKAEHWDPECPGPGPCHPIPDPPVGERGGGKGGAVIIQNKRDKIRGTVHVMAFVFLIKKHCGATLCFYTIAKHLPWSDLAPGTFSPLLSVGC